MATFGYTSQGATDISIYNSNSSPTNNAGLFTLTENGTVTKISAYVREEVDRTSAAVVAIYTNNAGVPQTRLGYTSPVTIQGTGYALYDFTFALPIHLNAGDYWLSITGNMSDPSGGNQDIFVAGESSGGTNAVEVDSLHSSSYPVPNNPWDTATDSFGSKKLSIYATYTSDIFTSTGVWFCPEGVTLINVDCWAAGGGSQGGSFGGAARQGSGGGAYKKKLNISVTPGNSYTVTVGVGGIGGAVGSNPGQAGGDSWFSTTGTVLAKGGDANGSGGLASGGIGDTKFSGGTGGMVGDVGGAFGGGGGGGAGTTGDGGNGTASSGVATNGVGGTGISVGGGNGGDGGVNGNIKGGGGGGAGGGSGGPNGARGEVQVTYTLPPSNGWVIALV